MCNGERSVKGPAGLTAGKCAPSILFEIWHTHVKRPEKSSVLKWQEPLFLFHPLFSSLMSFFFNIASWCIPVLPLSPSYAQSISFDRCLSCPPSLSLDKQACTVKLADRHPPPPPFLSISTGHGQNNGSGPSCSLASARDRERWKTMQGTILFPVQDQDRKHAECQASECRCHLRTQL